MLDATAVRPFEVDVPEAAIEDMCRRMQEAPPEIFTNELRAAFKSLR